MPAAERVSKQLSGGWRLQRPGYRPRCPSEEVRGYTVTAAPCNYIPELIVPKTNKTIRLKWYKG